MPVALDLLTRVRNIHWGGGVFIAGDDNSNIHYFKIGDSAWRNLGTLDFAKREGEYFTGWVQGSAYARSVFVLVGGGGSTRAQGIIMASRNGLNWSRVFTFGEKSESYIGAVIFGVVWDEDEQTFYAGGNQSDNFAAGGSTLEAWSSQTDLLFSSRDGYTWREVDRKVMRIRNSFPPESWPEYKTGLLEPHCSSLVEDSNDNGVADGVYGHQKSTGVLIEPADPATIDYLFGSVDIDAADNVVIHNASKPPSSHPGIPVTCVAYVGGRWMAAGGASGASKASMLEGSDWTIINPSGTSRVITICGGKP